MRWYNLKAKDLQIAGTRPAVGSIPVFFNEEDYYLHYEPEMGEPYFISEVTEGYKPGSRCVKIRDNIDKSKALIWDMDLEGTTIPETFNKVIKEHIKAKPEMWI